MSEERRLTGPLRGLGEALWMLRAQAHLTQYELAERAGLTRGLIGAYETERTVPNLESLEKMLDTLGVDRFGLANALRSAQGLPTVVFESSARSSRPEGPLTTFMDLKLSAATETQFLNAVRGLRDAFLTSRGLTPPTPPKTEETPPRRRRGRPRKNG